MRDLRDDGTLRGTLYMCTTSSQFVDMSDWQPPSRKPCAGCGAAYDRKSPQRCGYCARDRSAE